MEYEQMREMEKSHVCAQCGGEPTTTWDAENDCYRLVCGTDTAHNGFQKRPTATQLLSRGKLDEVAGKGAQKSIEALAKRQPDRFNLLPRVDVETGALLSPDDIQGLEDFAKSIGLNIYLGHVELYYGKPRVSIDGYYYLAKAKAQDISVCALPASSDEYEKYKVPKENYFSIARGWVDGKEVHEVGLGVVPQDEVTELSQKTMGKKGKLPIVRFPQRMAEKRAEWQLLRKLIPLEVKE